MLSNLSSRPGELAPIAALHPTCLYEILYQADWPAKTNHWAHHYKQYNINIFSHQPEIHTFASNFHGYNPQNCPQRPFKIQIF
jgi:hypothetical protein